MENNSQFDRELLSGYLDDALSNSERQHAEQLLAREPSAARYLEELRSARQAIQSLAAPRLRSSLANRVIELARSQAISDGLPVDHHVMLEPSERLVSFNDSIAQAVENNSLNISANSPASALVTPASSGSSDFCLPADSKKHDGPVGRQHLMWGSLAMLAAGLLWMVVVPFRTASEIQPLVSDAGSSVTDAGVPEVPDTAPRIAQELPADASPDRAPRSPNATNMLPGGTDTPAVAVRSNAGDGLKPEADGSLSMLDILFVMDVVMRPEAWDEGRFDKLLARHGLPITKAIRAEKELLTALVESRVVLASSDAPSEERSEIALIFVQCKVTDLERIAVEVESDQESFSDLMYDVGLDDKRMILARLLRKSAGKNERQGRS